MPEELEWPTTVRAAQPNWLTMNCMFGQRTGPRKEQSQRVLRLGSTRRKWRGDDEEVKRRGNLETQTLKFSTKSSNPIQNSPKGCFCRRSAPWLGVRGAPASPVAVSCSCSFMDTLAAEGAAVTVGFSNSDGGRATPVSFAFSRDYINDRTMIGVPLPPWSGGNIAPRDGRTFKLKRTDKCTDTEMCEGKTPRIWGQRSGITPSGCKTTTGTEAPRPKRQTGKGF